METWAWWLIWVGLALFALTYLGCIGWDLLGKAARAAKTFEAGAKQVEALVTALEKPAEIANFDGNLLDESGPLIAEHSRNLRKREAKRQERQRRLINKLIDYDESEFKP